MQSPDPIKFVKNLELAQDHGQFEDLPRAVLESDSDTEGKGFVNDRSVLTIHNSVSPQDRQDILDSLLLAQLAANKKFSDPTDILSWFQVVKNIMQNVGWQISEDKIFSHQSKGSLLEMHQSVADLLVAAIGSTFAAIVLKTIGAVKGLADDDSIIKVFESNTHLGEKAGFQMGFAANEQGVTELSLGAFKALTEDKRKTILFFKSGKEHLKLDVHLCEAHLNSNNYAIVREAIQDKLAEVTSKYIAEIPI